MVTYKFHQYQVVGRALPTETEEHPKIYRMKLWATNEVRAKSKFWYFLRKLKKVKKSNGQILAINEDELAYLDIQVQMLRWSLIFEKNPTTIKNYGIWLRYQSRTGYHNMYKEYRDTTLNGAVEQMYTEMASRHRVRPHCIQIIKTATIPAKLCKRESTKQFHDSKIKFPLVFRKNEAGMHRNSSINKQRENSQKAFDITVHGILLWASMGFLMPVGILTIRMSSTKECRPSTRKILFYVHAVVQVLSILLVTVGAVLSIRKFENAFNNSHQRIGLALYIATYLQVLTGFRRPKRGSRTRRAWYFSHWILGTTVCLVGILNVYTGLQAYHKRTSRSSTLWTIVFTAEVSFMVIFYLFQDKWEYIQKQGVMINGDGGPDNISPAAGVDNNRKDIGVLMNEPCRKSNALGTYFSRTNALDKLFQLT
ncbi:60S ribosomal protein L18a [Sesamum angolense]|uniref:60S ribosomal protein L18a n=1 Tax=Sesamum angolense TaxID=2727404 RepID=A0AAE1W4I7_9LAMI|nr:60S ribosomal protein L18a [Sesamum angolense]